jgi:hypothetical protein
LRYVKRIITEALVVRSDDPHIVGVEKSVLNKDDLLFNIALGYLLAFTIWNTMQFQNVTVFSDYFVDFNRVASTGNDFDL